MPEQDDTREDDAEPPRPGLSRRRFLERAGLGAVAASLVGQAAG